ncbi:alpha/beta hydrolase [Corynebacterium uterequi]|uniref:Lysophospholipase n=1 Tax=Corynebacterium uterequi TaxID=1072256 RepID=A0A0G3HJP2_9CORY|nr:alpha/beta hydrolase [Corynebacterium uterequi]AKK11342.1 lysophospholipase [Corynebacterium uterequi]
MTTDSSTWQPDILGADFEQQSIPLDPDPDFPTEVTATLVRYTASAQPGRTAVLWVHGLSDYFFHTHVAQRLHDEGFAVYALDLRACGRSRRPGQHWHYSTDIARYGEELTKALSLIVDAGHDRVVPLAHSTGGLIVPLWLSALHSERPELHAHVAGAILNSPWLDMMYPRAAVIGMRALAGTIGRIWPGVALPAGKLDGYGVSLHASKNGEWDFDTRFKPLSGHRIYLGWLGSILKSQKAIHAGGVDAAVPTLVLRSSQSYLGQPYSAATDTADAVLDVEQIARRAPLVSSTVTQQVIEGARHDVFLSLPHAREQALDLTVEWLRGLER